MVQSAAGILLLGTDGSAPKVSATELCILSRDRSIPPGGSVSDRGEAKVSWNIRHRSGRRRRRAAAAGGVRRIVLWPLERPSENEQEEVTVVRCRRNSRVHKCQNGVCTRRDSEGVRISARRDRKRKQWLANEPNERKRRGVLIKSVE